MNKILKFALLSAAPLLIIACDSGTPAPPPAATTGAATTGAATTGAGAAATATTTAAAAETAAAVEKDWTTTVVATPEGGFRMGNPDARVKLVEFASFTCPHCRDFHKEAVATLKPNYVKTGMVSLEYRPFVLNVYDFAATKLAMCEGPDRFFTWADQLFSHQESWVTPFTKLTEADIEPLKALPPEQQVAALAVAGGLRDFARPRGLSRARFDACLSDAGMMQRLTAQQQAASDRYQIAGTPTFLLNGKKVEGVTTWAALRPKIDAAL